VRVAVKRPRREAIPIDVAAEEFTREENVLEKRARLTAWGDGYIFILEGAAYCQHHIPLASERRHFDVGLAQTRCELSG